MNRWLWGQLRDFELKSGEKAFKNYAPHGSLNLIPIVPTQQDPTFTNIAKGAPFIVYNYITSHGVDEWWVSREQASFIVYDNNESRLRAISSYMTALLRRGDWTARNINDFISPSTFDFKFVEVLSASGPDEFTQEGGRQGAMVVVRYEYTVNTDTNDGSGLLI